MKTTNLEKVRQPTISIIEARQVVIDLFGSSVSSGYSMVAAVRRIRAWSKNFNPVVPMLPLSNYTTTELKRELKRRHEARFARLVERDNERRTDVAAYCKDKFGVDIAQLYPVSAK